MYLEICELRPSESQTEGDNPRQRGESQATALRERRQDEGEGGEDGEGGGGCLDPGPAGEAGDMSVIYLSLMRL